MPSNKRPLPRLIVNYDVLVMETLGEVTNAQLGLLVRALAWAVNVGRDDFPIGLLGTFADDGADYQQDTAALLASGLIARKPGSDKHFVPGPLALQVLPPA